MNQTAEIINIEDRQVVKADTDDGFDKVASTLTDTLTNPPIKLSARELRVILCIIGKTYRYHKKSDWITNSQIAEKTGIKPNHISELKNGLISKGVLIESGRNIGINNIISDWGIIPKTGQNSPKTGINENTEKSQKRDSIVPKLGLDSPENGIKQSQKRDTHKKTTNTIDHTTLDQPAKRASQIPENFSVNQKMRDWSLQNKLTIDIDKETENFKDYWLSKGEARKDWVAGWRMWMRKAQIYFNTQQTHTAGRVSKARPENFKEKDYGESTFEVDL